MRCQNGAKKKLLRMFAIMTSCNYMMSADEVAQDRSFTLLYILE